MADTDAPEGASSDADRFAEEAAGIGPILHWRGHEYTLEPELPAIVVFEAMRLAKSAGPGADVSDESALQMLEDLLGGADRVGVILRETHTPARELADLLTAATEAYTGKLPEQQPPNRAARRAKA